jgi:Putative motility protein
MSSIPAPVQQVLQARSDATRQQINTALLKKTLDSQKQTGDAINQLLSQAVDVQRQLASGHIDVRV